MKTFFSVSSLVLFASEVLADLQDVSLFVSSSDSSIDGSGISAPHEGAGINFLFVGNGGGYLGTANTIPFTYNTTQQALFWEINPILTEYFTVSPAGHGFDTAQVTVAVAGSGVTFVNGYLAFEGSTDGFYAVYNISDPYDYSKSNLAIVRGLSASPEGGIPISLTAVFGGSSATASATTTSAPATTSSVSVATETSTTSAESSTTVAVISEGGAASGAIIPGSFLGAAALAAGLLI